MGEPKDFQVRIKFRVDGKTYLEDFFTTESICDGLTKYWPEHEKFQEALKKLNKQMLASVGCQDPDRVITYKDIYRDDLPKPVGIRLRLQDSGQQRMLGHEKGKRGKYFTAPLKHVGPLEDQPSLDLDEKEKKPDLQERLFEDF